MRLFSFLLLIALASLAAPGAFAHPLPDSQIFLDIERDRVEVELRLPIAQFEIGFDAPVPRTSEALSPALRRAIARYVVDHLSAADRDGTVWRTDVRDIDVVVGRTDVRDIDVVVESATGHSGEGTPHLYVTATLVPPSALTPRNFVLRTDLVVHELLTHRLFVYLRRDFKVGDASTEPFILGRITWRSKEVAVDLFGEASVAPAL